ncbi:diguanylate cyclase [bacterium 0.1xD8-71]|nr:diguanylate cyclase [bacterium 0.1xD8-71]
MYSVNYKDYLDLVLKSAELCAFEVNVERQEYLNFENAEAIYKVPGDKILSELKEFSSLAPDAYMKAVSDYFVHPDDHETVSDAFGKVLSGRRTVYDARMKSGSGEYRWCRVCAAPYAKGEEVHMIGVVSDVSSLYELIFEEKEKSMRDAFTGCYNKNAFKELSQKLLNKRPRPSYAFIMMDLDDFKTVNDTFGHDVGDEILLEAVSQIKKSFPKQSLIGRFGGDEFMVLCPFSQKESLIEMINRFMENTISSYSVGKSVGYTFVPDDGKTDYEDLLKTADKALYAAKRKKNGMEAAEKLNKDGLYNS